MIESNRGEFSKWLRPNQLAHRLGFVREGTLRGAAQKGDEFIDLDVYGLLEDAWQGADAHS